MRHLHTLFAVGVILVASVGVRAGDFGAPPEFAQHRHLLQSDAYSHGNLDTGDGDGDNGYPSGDGGNGYPKPCDPCNNYINVQNCGRCCADLTAPGCSVCNSDGGTGAMGPGTCCACSIPNLIASDCGMGCTSDCVEKCAIQGCENCAGDDSDGPECAPCEPCSVCQDVEADPTDIAEIKGHRGSKENQAILWALMVVATISMVTYGVIRYTNRQLAGSAGAQALLSDRKERNTYGSVVKQQKLEEAPTALL